MQVLHDSNDGATLRLSREEIIIISNALNEVCYGLDRDEFGTRMGASLAEVETLLGALQVVLDSHHA